MQQPSAQGIAALYRGNPAPLQQKIQQEQKANPTMGPDLQKMLALQIVTEEKDNAMAQKAMQQLQQMSGPSGQPPTVMALLEQKAQQMQAAQGMPGMAAPAPQGAGIDQLPADFQMAEGGIVAFAEGGGYETPYDRMNRKNREEAAEADTPESRKDSEGIMKALKFVGGLPIEALKTLVSAPGYGFNKDEAPAAPAAASAVGAGRGRVNPPMANPEAPRPVAAPVAAPVKAPAGIAAALPAAAAAAPEGSTQAAYDKYLNRVLTTDRDTERAAEEARYAAVGKPDTSQYDRMVAELEKRKAQFEAPKPGFDALMEYLGKVGEGGRGRRWYEAGAQGAAGVTALNKERQTQQFELTKQGVEIAQKKLDAERAFGLDKYKAGQEGAKRVDDAARDAAKEFGLDARAEKDLANRIKVQLLQNQGALAAANVRASGAGGADKQQLAELKALQSSLKDQLKTTYKPAERQKLQAQLDQVNMAVAQMAGLDTMGGAPGAASPGGNMSGWGKAQVVK